MVDRHGQRSGEKRQQGGVVEGPPEPIKIVSSTAAMTFDSKT